MSRILIVGSKRFSEAPKEAELKRFEELASELGVALAERGHEIVVCSASDATADWCVVGGANGVGKPSKKVAVSFFVSHDELESMSGEEPYDESSFPNISRTLRLTGGGWFSTYDLAVSYGDAVVALGGSERGTGAALYTALARRKPVIGLPGCGGAAKVIWRDTEEHYDRLPPETRVPLESSSPAKAARAAVEAAEHLIRNNPFPRKSPALVYAFYPLAMIAFASAWVLISFVWDAEPAWKPFAVAGLMAFPGMLLRYVQDSARNEEAYFGTAKVMKDAARVLGLVLLASLLLDWTVVQAGSGEVSKMLLQTKTLAIVGFAAGFISEEMSELLTNSLRGVVRTTMEGKK